MTHIPEPCAAQLSFRSLKHGPSGHEIRPFSCTGCVWNLALDGCQVSNVSLNKLVSILNHRVKGDILVSEMFQVRHTVYLCLMCCYVCFSFSFCLCLLLQQVNGTFRPSSRGSTWGNLLPLCSFSHKTITTEEPTCLKENKDVAIVASAALLCNN